MSNQAYKLRLVDRFAYYIIHSLHDIWTDFGKPCPRFTRFIRHRLIGKFWPTQNQNFSISTPTNYEPSPVHSSIENRTAFVQKVAVIIPCHNYGHYLIKAIESVIGQTLRPIDVIVSDDASDDNTFDVGASFEKYGVRYLRGEWRDVGAARNAGMKMTNADYLVFLDADDYLHPDYLLEGVRTLLNHPEAAIAYPDHHCFGESNERRIFSNDLDWKRFERKGYISTASMVRREALAQAGGWSEGPHRHHDWITWRRILRLGWKAIKSPGIHYYRLHRENAHKINYSRIPYAYRTGLLDEPVTLFLSLSGRTWAWPLTSAFLEKQTFPHDKIHLVIMNTSRDIEFRNTVRTWLAQSDYASTTHLHELTGRPGLADLPRTEVHQEVRDACARIYNRFARLCTTTLAFFLEDDVIPPADVYIRLTEQFTEDVVSVSAHYNHRARPAPVSWEWTPDGKARDIPEGRGISFVGGNGFGCAVVRGEALRRYTFKSGPPFYNYDQHFYFETVFKDGWKALIDWGLRCRHLENQSIWK